MHAQLDALWFVALDTWVGAWGILPSLVKKMQVAHGSARLVALVDAPPPK